MKYGDERSAVPFLFSVGGLFHFVKGDITLYYQVKFILGLLLWGAVVSGCQNGGSDLPEVAPVRGVITMDNAPLSGATVIFYPENGRPSSGVANEKGEYVLSYTDSIAGAKLGRHTVSITTAPIDEPARERVPAKFNTATTLTAEIKPGQNEVNFNLESK